MHSYFSYMKTYVLIAAVLLLIGVAIAVYAFTRDPESAAIVEPTSFEECTALYPVMESYPRRCMTPSGLSFTEEVAEPAPQAPATAQIDNLIRVDTPTIGARVGSPLTITGEARGYWFFEASFGVEVRNAQGTVLTEHYIEATEDWMTEEFVPFRGEISFPAQAAGSTGSVVLKRANASGDPERDQELVIPVTF